MRKITVSDFLIEFLISNNVTDVFGYQGGMICHIFDSLGKYSGKIKYHSCGNEQGAAFAACGYAQATGKLGVVLTTSGPGFTNAITGLANAWFDSVPLMLISGQVNTKDKRRDLPLRQYGFQEIQANEIANSIVKKTYSIDLDTNFSYMLNEAYNLAFKRRKGPVYLDLPINVCREIIEVEDVLLPVNKDNAEKKLDFNSSKYIDELLNAKKPIIIAGGGIKQCGFRNEFRDLINLLKIPVVTTMPGVDLLSSDSPYRVGYLGGTARREAGVVLRNADFVLSIGTRLCNKAIGYNHDNFIPKARKFIRIDIDKNEFERKLKDCEEDVNVDLRDFISSAIVYAKQIEGKHNHSEWIKSIHKLKEVLCNIDVTFGNEFIRHLSNIAPDESIFSFDVGNNLIYGEQSVIIKNKTKVFESAGLGSMGYAIPASIGMAVNSKIPVYAISGDGGAQMNIQELNTISKMNLPIKIIVMNNHVLGHIILFQDHYLDCRRIATTEENNDYYSCDFVAVGNAYGLRSYRISKIEELDDYKTELLDDKPLLIELDFEDCSMLPNIHGGLDPLTNGPTLPENVVRIINELMK